ncbi:hypothetical protein CMI37_25545 [Candidatus Pacearchaeota archaeon]|nr:hypothetical protein [Candidatus Pacearchaeota archaeon]|tara:strand:- start:8869 stop:9120 length:252 start_codon:yes stop_codon:yes gene_type:complete
MVQSNNPKSEGDDSALRRFIDSTHINPLFIDESLAAEEADDDVDDDDEDYEPSEIEKLAMMDEDEYVAYMLDYITEYKKKQGR